MFTQVPQYLVCSSACPLELAACTKHRAQELNPQGGLQMPAKKKAKKAAKKKKK
jgi:hypothetical protein